MYPRGREERGVGCRVAMIDCRQSYFRLARGGIEGMDARAPVDMVLFEGFCLDRRGGGLFRQDKGGVSGPVAIGSRALDVLGVLIDRRGDLVSRDEIMAAAWPGTVVEDNNLAVQISALRRVLDQDRIKG